MSGVELAACPFCSGPASLTHSDFELHSGWHVVCHGDKNCPLFCSQPYRAHDTEAEAITIWNRRAVPMEAVAWRERATHLENAIKHARFQINDGQQSAAFYNLGRALEEPLALIPQAEET